MAEIGKKDFCRSALPIQKKSPGITSGIYRDHRQHIIDHLHQYRQMRDIWKKMMKISVISGCSYHWSIICRGSYSMGSGSLEFYLS